MRITSEQASAKLAIIPKPIEELSDEELMEYIVALRGMRGQATKKARAPKDPNAPKSTTPKLKSTREASTGDFDDLV